MLSTTVLFCSIHYSCYSHLHFRFLILRWLFVRRLLPFTLPFFIRSTPPLFVDLFAVLRFVHSILLNYSVVFKFVGVVTVVTLYACSLLFTTLRCSIIVVLPNSGFVRLFRSLVLFVVVRSFTVTFRCLVVLRSFCSVVLSVVRWFLVVVLVRCSFCLFSSPVRSLRYVYRSSLFRFRYVCCMYRSFVVVRYHVGALLPLVPFSLPLLLLHFWTRSLRSTCLSAVRWFCSVLLRCSLRCCPVLPYRSPYVTLMDYVTVCSVYVLRWFCSFVALFYIRCRLMPFREEPFGCVCCYGWFVRFVSTLRWFTGYHTRSRSFDRCLLDTRLPFVLTRSFYVYVRSACSSIRCCVIGVLLFCYVCWSLIRSLVVRSFCVSFGSFGWFWFPFPLFGSFVAFVRSSRSSFFTRAVLLPLVAYGTVKSLSTRVYRGVPAPRTWRERRHRARCCCANGSA